jgi:hypothetical protein
VALCANPVRFCQSLVLLDGVRFEVFLDFIKIERQELSVDLPCTEEFVLALARRLVQCKLPPTIRSCPGT